MQKLVPLNYCMDCGSFNTISGYVEDEERLKIDAKWHIEVADRNKVWARNFLKAVKHRFPHIESILEIGCATGTLLSVAREEFGMRVKGFDTNKYAINEGLKGHQGIELIPDYWFADTLTEKFDLIVCISVFEHLPEPISLMREISEYCHKHNSACFVSVPYFERDKWNEMLEDDPGKNPASDLRLIDVHVLHFTKRGLATMATKCGATSVVYFPRGWRGHWLEFN
jgi:SAM-dependent methyltransferase